jgi:uncharacterized OsmC-like protein
LKILAVSQEVPDMAEHSQFTISLEQLRDFEFKVIFDGEGIPELLLDEPAPVGSGVGPNASRILGAAVANCLSASLLFCLRKARQEPSNIKATVNGSLARDDRGRLRVAGFDVFITVAGVDKEAAGFRRCSDLFEDFCVVTASVRKGIPINAQVFDESGERLA